ncbi:MAG: hypothetical protein QM766_13705 [Burkholderiaceae bacterium]
MSKVSWGLACGLLLASCLLALVPFHPQMPRSGLDPSWAWAVGQAAERQLRFGVDVVFTYGPLSSIHSEYYVPRFESAIFGLSLYLAIVLASLLIALLSGGRTSWRVLILPVVLLLFGAENDLNFALKKDALLALIPVLLVFYVERAYRLEYAFQRCRFLIFAACLPSLGVLPLVKLNLAVIVVAGAACLAFVFAARRAYRALLILACIPSLTMIGSWLAAGQSLTDLPAYFLSTVPVISGYTEAMSLSGSPWLPVAFAVGAGSLFSLAVVSRLRFGSPGLAEISMIAAILLVAFKGGFVRQDDYHTVGSGLALIVLALVLSPFFSSGRMRAALVLSIGAGAAIVVISGSGHTADWASGLMVRTAKAFDGLKSRLAGGDAFSKDYAKAKAAIAREDPIPLLEGRVDIYSYGQAALLASDNQWTPRPVFQSYAAYTPALQSINARHLSGVDAPEHIVFAVETIDARLPTLDDGASWPALLVNYAPVEKIGRRIVLRRQNDTIPEMIELGRLQARLGQKFDLPEFDGQVYMVANVVPSGLGKLKSLLFKPDTLMATIDRGDGGVVRYRLVSGMMRTPFLISPLIETTSEFLALYADSDFVADKRVRQMTIDGVRPGSGDWQDVIEVTFHGLHGPRSSQVATMLGFAQPEPMALPDAGACIGAIDSINGYPAADPRVGFKNLLSVQGWAAIDGRSDSAGVRTVVFLEGGGQTFMAPTEAVARPDVVEHFKAPGMLNSGYAATVDMSGLAGDFVLRIGIVDGERTTLCPLPPVLLRGR